VDDDRTGQVIAGRYRVERQLGRGAFGLVWLAQRGDGASVVLKVLHPQWARVPTVVERFRREGLVTNMINHPHVAQIYEQGTIEDGTPYIALEYLPGGTLKEELKATGAMPLGRVAQLWAPVCDAVAAAHAAGIVHRDLKPENVMLTQRGSDASYPVVLDFGIAKFLDAAEKLTSTGSMLGTPTYMAPEQCRGQTDLGPPADVYALGAICFELLMGHPPFAGRTVAELAMHHLLDAPPPLDGAPRELAQLIALCLAKEPSQRPDATALADALRRGARVHPGKLTPSAIRPAVAPPPSSVAETVLMPSGRNELATAVRSTGQTPRPRKGPSTALLVAAVVMLMLAASALVAVLMLRN
jgi:serine/threonine-protein kinase